MEETKPWWQSKSIIGSVLVIIVLGLRLLGRVFEAEAVEAETESIADWWLEAVGLVSGLLAFIGRLTAKKELTK